MNFLTRVHRTLRTALRPLTDLQRYRITHCQPEWLLPPSQPISTNEVVLVTCGFGPERYKQAARRLAAQASRLGRFKQIYAFTHLNEVPGLTTACQQQLESLARQHPRGWGLWAWKPAVVAAVMKSLPEGTEIFYIDAGCEISSWGGLRFDSWRMRLRTEGSLFFSIPYMEREWTTAEVLSHFGLPLDECSAQIQATWFAVVNNDKWRLFFNSWAKKCLLDDARLLKTGSEESNTYLLEHREDQSVLSCMLKKLGKFDALPHEDHFLPELYQPNSWVLRMPIHTLRLAGSTSIVDVSISASAKYKELYTDPWHPNTFLLKFMLSKRYILECLRCSYRAFRMLKIELFK